MIEATLSKRTGALGRVTTEIFEFQQIPQQHRLVVAAAGQGAAVRTEGHRQHVIAVAGEGLAEAAGMGPVRQIPQQYRPIVAADGQSVAVRTKTSFRSFGVGLAGSEAMTTLADDLVPDELWAIVEPLLPAPPRPPYGGRHRTISDRACLAAIVYMARTSTPWRLLPARELGCGSPATCWRRLTEWANAGVFDALHLQVLDRLGERGQLDWSRAAVDTMSVRAKRGGTTWAQIQSIVASLEPSSTWSATMAGCR
jgi:transposase